MLELDASLGEDLEPLLAHERCDKAWGRSSMSMVFSFRGEGE